MEVGGFSSKWKQAGGLLYTHAHLPTQHHCNADSVAGTDKGKQTVPTLVSPSRGQALCLSFRLTRSSEVREPETFLWMQVRPNSRSAEAAELRNTGKRGTRKSKAVCAGTIVQGRPQGGPALCAQADRAATAVGQP